MKLVYLLGVFLLLSLVISGFGRYLASKVEESSSFIIRQDIATSVTTTKLSQPTEFTQAELTNRISVDTERISGSVSDIAIEFPINIMLIFGCVLGLLIVDPIAFMIIIIFATISILINIVLTRVVARENEVLQKRVDDITETATSILRCLRILTAAGSLENARSIYQMENRSAYHQGIKVARLVCFSQPLSASFLHCGLLLILGLGAVRVSSGSISIATLATFVLFLTYLLVPLSSAVYLMTRVGELLSSYVRISELFGTSYKPGMFETPDSEQKSQGISVQSPVESFQVRGLCFAYNQGEDLIKSVGLGLADHGVTVIKGPSGSGKSTLVDLLCGFLNPESGEYLVNLNPLPGENNWCGRGGVMVVPQDYEPWGKTIRDTITLSNRDIDDADIINVLPKLNLEHWFAALPAGLDTEHRLLDKNASGGELKRLGILRAMLVQPKILILDEPTANLDARNVSSIVELVRDVSQNIGVLIITHDKHFDSIGDCYVLANGYLTRS